MENIATNIKYLRKERAWTQKQLAEKLAVSEDTVQKWEKGINRVPVSELVKIREIFGVSLDALVDEKINK